MISLDNTASSLDSDRAQESLPVLKRWLGRRRLTWLDDVAIAWLDPQRYIVLAIRGRLARGESVLLATESAKDALNRNQHEPDSLALRTTADTVIGAIGVHGRSSAENFFIACLLGELIFNPLENDEVLAALVEEHFIQAKRQIPDIPLLDQPGISSQAGFAAVLAGAGREGLLPGQRFGWPPHSYGVPPLSDDVQPPSRPTQQIITSEQIPGVNGGLA